MDITVGSGYGLTIDSFGSMDLGSDMELALCHSDGTLLLPLNDDFQTGVFGDAHLAFGDAPQSEDPFNGFTRQNPDEYVNPRQPAGRDVLGRDRAVQHLVG